MEVPGMNPLQSRPVVPGTQGQTGVPDLILNPAQTRAPTQQPEQAPATQGPYQAPDQPVVQHSVQNLTAALMEMNIAPTPQNLQMAQLLANYGHAVNTQTMGILRQAMSGISDKSAAAMEATVILLSRGLPVNEQTVNAIKQFLNGQPLQQQLQALPQELGTLVEQMQQTAQQSSTQTGQAATQAPLAQNAQAAALAAGEGVQGLPQQVAQQVAQQTGTAPQAALQANAQQVAQNVQSGQALVQAAPTAASAQQYSGQAQAIENKSDHMSRIADKSTAQRVEMEALQQGELKAVEAIDDKAMASQSRQVAQHLPSARNPADQQSLQQLYLYLQGGEALEQLGPRGSGQLQSSGEALLQLLKNLQDLSQISAHLNENMQLKDFQMLGIQHHQIVQLTGLLEQKLQEFHVLFERAFPDLHQEVQRLLQEDGLDVFSKLSQLIEENMERLHERLRLPGDSDEKNQVLLTLRSLMEQVGFQVEKVQTHMMARQMLSQTLPCHCIPITVHANGESHPAEIFVHQDYDPDDPHSGPDAEQQLKLTLTLETKNLGRVAVDLATLKGDMTLDLKVINRRVKQAIDTRLEQLKHKVEKEYTVSHLNCRVVPELESRQSMLLPPKRAVRSLRRVEGVV